MPILSEPIIFLHQVFDTWDRYVRFCAKLLYLRYNVKIDHDQNRKNNAADNFLVEKMRFPGKSCFFFRFVNYAG